MIPKWTRSNPEQIPVLRPVKAVPPVRRDADQLDMRVMHEQDSTLEPQSSDLAHAKAHASNALGGAARRGDLEQALSQAQLEVTVAEEVPPPRRPSQIKTNRPRVQKPPPPARNQFARSS